MTGQSKYNYNDIVRFTWHDGTIWIGKIVVVDAYGTFEQSDEVSYDIMVHDVALFKHCKESCVTDLIKKCDKPEKSSKRLSSILSDEQAKHVMNIILSCERFTKLQTLVDSLDDIYPEFATEKEYLNKRALVYSDFLWSEYEALTGMSFDELNPLEHTEEIDAITATVGLD